MEEDSTRTPAGNLPQIFADRSPWHDKASSARLAPSSLAQQITTRDEKCTAADELGVAVWKRDQPDNRDDQAHPEKFLPSASDAKQAWHNRSQLEMRRARQRDELNVAVWKWGQPDNQWDDQAHPEKFLLHMYIGATVFAIYIYICCHCVCNIFLYIATIRLLNSACRQGVCLCGWSRHCIRIYVSDIYIYCHYSYTQLRLPTGSVIVWTKAYSIYIYIIWYISYLIRIYVSDIYILPLFVYSFHLLTGSVIVRTKSLFRYKYFLLDTYICVWYIYMLPLFVYPTPLAKTGSVIVWTKSRVRYIYISVDVVSVYICD